MPTLVDDTNYDIWLEHPYSGSATKVGYKIAREQGSPLIKESLAPFVAPQIYQGAYTYESTAANVNVPLAIEDWSGGCGFEYIPGNLPISKIVYSTSSGIDASWKNKLTLMAAKQTGGSTTQNPIKFVYNSYGIHVMTTRYVYEWTGAAWTSRFDNTNKTNTDLIEYKNSRGTYLVLTLSDDNYYISTDGVTFSQPNSGTITPTFRSSSAPAANSTDQITISKPSGLAEDDVMFATIMCFGVTPTAPSGWTLISSRTTETVDVFFYWKRASSTEPSSYTWYLSGGTFGGFIAAYQGCVTTGDPYDSASYGTANGAGTTVTTGSTQICIGDNRTYVVLIGSGDNTSQTAVTWTTAAGFTERVDAYTTGATVTLTSGVFDKTVTPGSIASAVFTASRSLTNFYSQELCLRPTAGGGALNNGMRLAVRGSADGEPLLWCVDSNGGIRNTPDPTHPGLWSAVDTLQFSNPFTIKGLEVLNNTFYLYTNKGIDFYDGTTLGTVWNNTTLTSASDDARPYTWVDQRTYFTYSGTLFRYDGSTIDKVWPRSYQSSNNTRTGTITSITGDERNLYFTVKDTSSAYWVMKCDPYVEYAVGDEAFMPVFEFTIPDSSVVNAMIVVPGASDTLHTTNPHLITGYGTNADYYILPRYGRSPDNDSNYRYQTAASTLTGSRYDIGAKLFPKFANSMSMFLEYAATSHTTSVDAFLFLTDGTTATHSVSGSLGLTSANITTDREFTQLRPGVNMTASSSTDVVMVTSYVFNSSLNPPRKRQWEITLEIDEDLELRGGGDSRYGARYLLDHLYNGLTERVVYYDRLGNSYITRILDLQSVAISRDKSLYNITLVQLV